MNFVIEYRKHQFMGDWFRIVVIEDFKRIKKSKWFQSQEMAHLRFRKQDYYAFSDWHKGFRKDKTTVFPVNQVIFFWPHLTTVRVQTEAEERREVRRNWFAGEKRNKKK